MLLRDDAWRGAYVRSHDAAFGKAPARKNQTVDPECGTRFAISLGGTFKAGAATGDCKAHSLASMALADTAKLRDLDDASQAAWRSLLSQTDRAAKMAERVAAALVLPEVTKPGLGIGGEGGKGVL